MSSSTTYYLVSCCVWNQAIQQSVTRNHKPATLSAAIDQVNHLTDNGRQDISVDELAPGAKKLFGAVVKRWSASGFLVANCEAYPIQGADPDAY